MHLFSLLSGFVGRFSCHDRVFKIPVLNCKLVNVLIGCFYIVLFILFYFLNAVSTFYLQRSGLTALVHYVMADYGIA